MKVGVWKLQRAIRNHGIYYMSCPIHSYTHVYIYIYIVIYGYIYNTVDKTCEQQCITCWVFWLSWPGCDDSSSQTNSSFMVTSASGNLSALEQLPNKDGLHNYWIALKGGWKRQNNMIAILLYIIIRSSKWWLLDGIWPIKFWIQEGLVLAKELFLPLVDGVALLQSGPCAWSRPAQEW